MIYLKRIESFRHGPYAGRAQRDPGALPEQVLANVRTAADGFVKGAPQFDDLTMLCLRYYGPDAGQSAERLRK